MDTSKLALSKSPFPSVSSKELALQISSRNKSLRKLPTWYAAEGIYYPSGLSVEQCSSEITAAYKAKHGMGERLIDLTGGFGIDVYYFAKVIPLVVHCEVDEDLSAIASHNAKILNEHNVSFKALDGLSYLQSNQEFFDTIYIDPARRSSSGKVFMLRDCTPNIVEHLDLLRSRSKRILIKTSPLLDISAALEDLGKVSEIHIVSVRNECKELLFILNADQDAAEDLKVIATALNQTRKYFSFYWKESADLSEDQNENAPLDANSYLYEPDAALLKSGAFDLIAYRYHLKKLDVHTHLYSSDQINTEFPGRIFQIKRFLKAKQLKKERNLKGNVILRNYPGRADEMIKKYKIAPGKKEFLIFTQTKVSGLIILEAEILQHY